MFQANIHALLLILALNKLLLAALIFHLKSRMPEAKGLNYWASGSLLTAIGIGIYSAMPFPAPVHIDFLYSLFLNWFVYLGDTLFLAGFWAFYNKKILRPIFWIFPLVATINIVFFTLFFNIIWIRYSINAFLGFVLYAYSANELRKLSNENSLKNLLLWSAYIYAFYAFLQLIRSILGLIFKPSDPTGESLVSVILIALAGISLIMLTFNLIVIIVSTLNDKLKEQILSKNKLHAIISHDLRNPIGNFMNYTELIKKHIKNNDFEKIDISLAKMQQASLSSRFLLENLLYWSQSQIHQLTISPKENDLVSLVRTSLKIVETMAFEKNIKIEFTQTNPIIGYFDENMISLVFRNVLTNALKYTKDQGIITVSIHENINQLELSVADNGVGISEEMQKTIFSDENFLSTKGTLDEKGSGFGLAFSKQFAELNKGDILVESKPGRGSVFTIVLPKSANQYHKVYR